MLVFCSIGLDACSAWFVSNQEVDSPSYGSKSNNQLLFKQDSDQSYINGSQNNNSKKINSDNDNNTVVMLPSGVK